MLFIDMCIMLLVASLYFIYWIIDREEYKEEG